MTAEIDRLALPEALGAWHADPLAPELLADRLAWVRESLNAAPDGETRFRLRLAEMRLMALQGRSVDAQYRSLRATAGKASREALVELIYGQLLLATRRAGAWRHLDEAFRMAADHLGPRDYLRVRRRHERLRHLEPLPEPVSPKSLNRLLREAAVIEQIERRMPQRRSFPADRHDTVG